MTVREERARFWCDSGIGFTDLVLQYTGCTAMSRLAARFGTSREIRGRDLFIVRYVHPQIPS